MLDGFSFFGGDGKPARGDELVISSGGGGGYNGYSLGGTAATAASSGGPNGLNGLNGINGINGGIGNDNPLINTIPPKDCDVSKAEMEMNKMHFITSTQENVYWPEFPKECLQFIRLMDGNHTCFDCQGFKDIDNINNNHNKEEPMYASISHGTLVCQMCAMAHARRQQQNASSGSSFDVKSFTDDRWSFQEILCLLEGGNAKFRSYCNSTSRVIPREYNAYNKRQLNDKIYSHKAIKTYTTNLRQKAEELHKERELLLQKDESYEIRTRLQQNKRISIIDHTNRDDTYGGNSGSIPNLISSDYSESVSSFCKDVPILSPYDFTTKYTSRQWPGVDPQDLMNKINVDFHNNKQANNNNNNAYDNNNNYNNNNNDRMGQQGGIFGGEFSNHSSSNSSDRIQRGDNNNNNTNNMNNNSSHSNSKPVRLPIKELRAIALKAGISAQGMLERSDFERAVAHLLPSTTDPQEQTKEQEQDTTSLSNDNSSIRLSIKELRSIALKAGISTQGMLERGDFEKAVAHLIPAELEEKKKREEEQKQQQPPPPMNIYDRPPDVGAAPGTQPPHAPSLQSQFQNNPGGFNAMDNQNNSNGMGMGMGMGGMNMGMGMDMGMGMPGGNMGIGMAPPGGLGGPPIPPEYQQPPRRGGPLPPGGPLEKRDFTNSEIITGCGPNKSTAFHDSWISEVTWQEEDFMSRGSSKDIVLNNMNGIGPNGVGPPSPFGNIRKEVLTSSIRNEINSPIPPTISELEPPPFQSQQTNQPHQSLQLNSTSRPSATSNWDNVRHSMHDISSRAQQFGNNNGNNNGRMQQRHSIHIENPSKNTIDNPLGIGRSLLHSTDGGSVRSGRSGRSRGRMNGSVRSKVSGLTMDQSDLQSWNNDSNNGNGPVEYRGPGGMVLGRSINIMSSEDNIIHEHSEERDSFEDFPAPNVSGISAAAKGQRIAMQDNAANNNRMRQQQQQRSGTNQSVAMSNSSSIPTQQSGPFPGMTITVEDENNNRGPNNGNNNPPNRIRRPAPSRGNNNGANNSNNPRTSSQNRNSPPPGANGVNRMPPPPSQQNKSGHGNNMRPAPRPPNRNPAPPPPPPPEKQNLPFSSIAFNGNESFGSDISDPSGLEDSGHKRPTGVRARQMQQRQQPQRQPQKQPPQRKLQQQPPPKQNPPPSSSKRPVNTPMKSSAGRPSPNGNATRGAPPNRTNKNPAAAPPNKKVASPPPPKTQKSPFESVPEGGRKKTIPAASNGNRRPSTLKKKDAAPATNNGNRRPSAVTNNGGAATKSSASAPNKRITRRSVAPTTADDSASQTSSSGHRRRLAAQRRLQKRPSRRNIREEDGKKRTSSPTKRASSPKRGQPTVKKQQAPAPVKKQQPQQPVKKQSPPSSTIKKKQTSNSNVNKNGVKQQPPQKRQSVSSNVKSQPSSSQPRRTSSSKVVVTSKTSSTSKQQQHRRSLSNPQEAIPGVPKKKTAPGKTMTRSKSKEPIKRSKSKEPASATIRKQPQRRVSSTSQKTGATSSVNRVSSQHPQRRRKG